MPDLQRLGRLAGLGCRYAVDSFAASPDLRRRARRSFAWKLLSLRPQATFRRGGFTWTAPTADSVSKSIFIEDHHQDLYISPIMKWVDPGRSTIVNIGAHIGDAALPLTRTGKHVIAIEPNPVTFGQLQTNVRQNGLEAAITCCQVAIADQPGSATLHIPGAPSNSSLITPSGQSAHGDEGSGRMISVETAPLGALLESLGVAPQQVALVWSDTEGYESRVVQSGASLWLAGVPLWAEVWPQGLKAHGGIDHFLHLCGKYFSRVLPADRLDAEPQPISNLARIVSALDDDYSDALFLP